MQKNNRNNVIMTKIIHCVSW